MHLPAGQNRFAQEKEIVQNSSDWSKKSSRHCQQHPQSLGGSDGPNHNRSVYNTTQPKAQGTLCKKG
ncbi:rCG46760 [Rattus norvegicus]|uniref:RCG46760 n=1 Tax=Rattus norvegicus TaxID=10116 RepID=A6IX43_RAT|nr:rCG46760 [Rattus norvegicus]